MSVGIRAYCGEFLGKQKVILGKTTIENRLDGANGAVFEITGAHTEHAAMYSCTPNAFR